MSRNWHEGSALQLVGVWEVIGNCKQHFSLFSLSLFCQTPLQLANPTQLQLVGVGVDFLFPLEEEGRKKEGISLT